MWCVVFVDESYGKGWSAGVAGDRYVYTANETHLGIVKCCFEGLKVCRF